MPLPLFMPFFLKGVIVVAKALSAKGATTAAAKGAVVVVKTVGVKTAAAATVSTLVGIGALQWSYERYLKAQAIVSNFDGGNYGEAATGLGSLISSFGVIHGNDFLDEGRLWIAEGASLTSSRFNNLILSVRTLINEMVQTGRTPLPF